MMQPITWTCTTRNDLPEGHVMMLVTFDDGRRKFTLPRYFDPLTVRHNWTPAMLYVEACAVLSHIDLTLARIDDLLPANAITGKIKVLP